MNYEEKRKSRINRLKEHAVKTQRNAAATIQTARDMASVIPFGQPILVGHHSESRDRNYRNRIHNKFGKGFELQEKAKHYAEKASAAENNTAIFSDDENAIEKLKTKIDGLVRHQAEMKAANKIVKSSKLPLDDKISQLCKSLKVTEETARKFIEDKDYAGRAGFPSYMLTNNNANIRRLKQRLQTLEESQTAEHKETEYEGFTIVENPDENRVQILFDNKQTYLDLCKSRGINLRSLGFKYAKSKGAWQRHLNNRGIWTAYDVAKKLTTP